MDISSNDVEVKTFARARRGYDAEEVAEYLGSVGEVMARLEERAKLAEVRTEQLQRDVHDLRATSEQAVEEAIAAKGRIIEAAEEEAAAIRAAAGGDEDDAAQPRSRSVPSTDEVAAIEANEIVARATSDAERIVSDAEALLAAATSRSQSAEAERDEIVANATALAEKTEAERDEILVAAKAEADAVVAGATEDASKVKAGVVDETNALRQEALEEHGELLGRLRELRVMVSEVEDLVPSVPVPDVDVAVAKELLEATEQVTVDLRGDINGVTEEEPTLAPSSGRTSRYRSRSAHLPTIGSDAAKVLDQMKSLREKS